MDYHSGFIDNADPAPIYTRSLPIDAPLLIDADRVARWQKARTQYSAVATFLSEESKRPSSNAAFVLRAMFSIYLPVLSDDSCLVNRRGTTGVRPEVASSAKSCACGI